VGEKKEVWPPSSPNYSLLDFFLWGVSELLVNAKLRNKIEDLFQKMKVVMGTLDRGTVVKACSAPGSRLSSLLRAIH
jgi:hypothetical protein